MKKLIFFLAIAFTFCKAPAQSTLTIIPSCKQTAHVGDTVTIFAQLLATNRFGSINFSLNPGAPNTPVSGTPTTTMMGGTSILGTTAFTVTGLAVGTYSWSVMGKDATGSSIEGQDSITVVAALPAPVPRTLVSATFSIGAITVTLPLAALTGVLYSDGATK